MRYGEIPTGGEEGRFGGGMSHTPVPISFFFSFFFFFAVGGGREGCRIILFSIVSFFLKKTASAAIFKNENWIDWFLNVNYTNLKAAWSYTLNVPSVSSQGGWGTEYIFTANNSMSFTCTIHFICATVNRKSVIRRWLVEFPQGHRLWSKIQFHPDSFSHKLYTLMQLKPHLRQPNLVCNTTYCIIIWVFEDVFV